MVHEDPVKEESIDVVEDYLEELADKIKEETSRKRPRVSHVFSAMQQQHIINKILKKKESFENRTVLEQEDMFRACRMGYDGLDEYREDAADKIVKLVSGVTLKKYKEALTPLGNYILGFKTLKDNCQKYIKPEEFNTAQQYYNEMKKRVADIDEETSHHIESKYTGAIQKDYGIKERKIASTGGLAGYRTPTTVWNIGGRPLRKVEHFQIMDAIAKYETKTGKNAIWRGAKTQPFLRFLRKWEKENVPKSDKEPIELGSPI